MPSSLMCSSISIRISAVRSSESELTRNGEVRALRVGVAGLGMAGGGILSTLARIPEVEVVASADPRPAARGLFGEEFHRQAHQSFEALCRDDSVEAIWIPTPTQLHASHVRIAA